MKKKNQLNHNKFSIYTIHEIFNVEHKNISEDFYFCIKEHPKAPILNKKDIYTSIGYFKSGNRLYYISHTAYKVKFCIFEHGEIIVYDDDDLYYNVEIIGDIYGPKIDYWQLKHCSISNVDDAQGFFSNLNNSKCKISNLNYDKILNLYYCVENHLCQTLGPIKELR